MKANPYVLPLVVAGVLVALTGCSSAPDRSELVERFEIELDGAVGENDWADVAEMMADHAYDGMCGSSIYWGELDGGFLEAWAVTCSMYFDDEMSEAQRAESKRLLLEQIADQTSSG